MSHKLYDQRFEQFGHLPENVLFDSIARNTGAEFRMRKAAVEIMLEKGYAKAHHPEISHLLAEIEAERSAKAEVEAIVEAAVETPIEDIPHEDDGPHGMTAGFTTQNMYQDEKPPIDCLEV